MSEGVTIMDPATTYIDDDVKVGRDTVIYPMTWLEHGTVIGEECEIGPNVRFQDVKCGNRVTGQFIYAHECQIVKLVQFVHLRPNTHLFEGVKIDNFIEVKNSNIGKGSKLPHLSYIGDCDMGENVNMGCGTITVNYDGKAKHRTKIGNNAFVGSTITKTAPKGKLSIARARQTVIESWHDKRDE